MSPAAKLAGFAGILALLFAGGALAGDRVGAGDPRGGERRSGMEAMSGDAGHGADDAPAPQAVRGLAVSDGGMTLSLERTTATPGRRFALRFRIADRRGRTVRDFDVEHTKRMHLIVVRRDMAGFQHLHPTAGADGTWSVPVTLPDPGSYRVFADFSVDGRPQTLAGDVTADGALRARPLPAPVREVEADGMRVSLTQRASRPGAESALAFTVTRDGEPVAVEPYLGARGHLVALREGDLAFLHVHPDERRLRFMAEFPTAGRYRLFLQFKAAGRVHTAEFTQEVSR